MQLKLVLKQMSTELPANIEATLSLLAGSDYIADRSLATTLFLSLKMGKPLFLEGEAGAGKTEIAKVLSAALDRKLVRLQCYEGLDVNSAVFEWNYSRQILEIRLSEAMRRQAARLFVARHSLTVWWPIRVWRIFH